MLKIARELRGTSGACQMWWNATGARVLAYDSDAVLLERAPATRSLADMARPARREAPSILRRRKAAHAPCPSPPHPIF